MMKKLYILLLAVCQLAAMSALAQGLPSYSCDPIAIPYSEDFNSYSNSVSTDYAPPSGYPDCDLPACWRFLNRSETSSAYPQAFISSYSAYVSTGNCLFLKSSNQKPLYAVLPALAADINMLQMTFKYRNFGTNEGDGTLEVGYMTNPTDTGTFVSLYTCPKTTTITEVEQLFNGVAAYGAGNSYIAFRYLPGTSYNYYLSIEDISVELIPSCLHPANLTVTNATQTSVELSWTERGAATAWNIEYGPKGFEQGTGTTVEASTKPFNVTGLTASTEYDFYVQSDCGNGSTSDWAGPVSGTPGSYIMPVSGTDTITMCDGIIYDSGGKYGNYSDNCEATFVVKPTTDGSFVKVQGIGNYATEENFDYLIVYDGAGTSGTQLFSTKGTRSGTIPACYSSSGPITLYFKSDVSQTYAGFALQVSCVECPGPNNIAATSISNNSIRFSWTERGAATAWNIEYGSKGFEQGTGTMVEASTKPFNVTGLTASTEYDFYVQSDCGNGSTSDWAGPVSATTHCNPMSVPYAEDFNSYSNSIPSDANTPSGYPDCDMPSCWMFLNRSETSSAYPKAFISSYSDYVSTGNCLFLRSSKEKPLYAVLPALAADINMLQMTFKYRNEGKSDHDGTLEVGYMTNPTDTGTFVSLYTCPKTTTLTEVKQFFNGVQAFGAGNSYIAFKYSGETYDNFYLSIEDVKVSAFLEYPDVKDTLCMSLPSVPVDRTFTPSAAPSDTLSYTWTVQSDGGVTGASGNATRADRFTATLSNSGTSAATVVYEVTPYVTITENGTANAYAGMPFEYSVTVLPKPAVTLTASDTVITSGQVATLTATPTPSTGTYTYTWTPASDLTAAGTAGNVMLTKTDIPVFGKTYTVKVTDSHGCESEEASKTIIMIDPGVIHQMNWTCGSDTTLRLNVSGMFPSDGPYQWQKQDASGNWADIAGATQHFYDVTATGKYRRSYSYGGDTVYTEVVSVTHPREQRIGTVEPVSGSATSVCDGSDATVKLKNNSTGSNCPAAAGVNWEMRVGTGDWTDQNTAADSLVKQLTAVTEQHEFRAYKSVYTNCKVYSSNTFVLGVNPKPAVTLTADNNVVCTGDVATLTAMPSPSTGTYTYTWTPAADFVAGNTDNVKHTNSDAVEGDKTYTVKVTDSHGCESEAASVTITTLPVVPTFAVINDTLCSHVDINKTFQPVQAATGTMTYTWAVKSNNGITGATGNSTPATAFTATNLINNGTAAATVVYEVTPFETHVADGVQHICTGTLFEYSLTLMPVVVTFANVADTFCSPKQTLNKAFASSTATTGTMTYTWTVKSNTGVTGADANSTPATAFTATNLINNSTAAATVVYEVTPYVTVTENGTANVCAGMPFEYSVTLIPSIGNAGTLTYDNSDVIVTLYYGACDTLLYITPPTFSTAIEEWNNSLTNSASTTSNTGALLGRVTPGTHTITWTVNDHCGNYVSFDRKYIVNYPACGSGITATDGDGNVYETVRIGCECWTKSNLKSTKYSNGTAVPFANGYSSLDYPNVADNIANFGRLYSWYSAVNVTEGDNSAVPATTTDPISGYVYVQGVCPEGWALPSTQSMHNMTDLAADMGMLRSTDQSKWLPGAVGMDALGISAVAAGHYDSVTARYLNLLGEAYFWSHDTHTATEASCLTVAYYCDQALYQNKSKGMGYSVRCVKRAN